MRLGPLALACSVFTVACSPARLSAPDDKGVLRAIVPASPETRTALGVTEWRLYENGERRVADGLSGAIVVELDSSPAGFAYAAGGRQIRLDAEGHAQGDIALLADAQRAGGLLEADVRREAASEPAPAVQVCDAEAAALADTIARAAMTCQASPGSQACKTALHDIRLALHVLLDCILPQNPGGDGGLPEDGGIADGGTDDGGASAICGGSEPKLALFPGCTSQSWGQQPGESCWRAIQCQPICCSCNGGSSWSAAACLDGKCADQTNACSCVHDVAPQLCP